MGFTPPEKMLKIAYVLLWFPLSSETFIYREIEDLRKNGLNIIVYTMYGKAFKGCSAKMLEYAGSVNRMGIGAFFRILTAFFKHLKNKPALVYSLMRKGLFRRMRNLESQLENLWCFFAGFLLADLCLKDSVSLIHASWANGPATAAWIASQLSGIPFAFTGRAGDIYPADGILAEKSEAALFVRANNLTNVKWLASFCPENAKHKVKLIYNGLTFTESQSGCKPKAMPNPPKILAIGRFARTKGFPELLTAMARLRRENVNICLTLIGDGSWKKKLLSLRKRLNLEDRVEMPGFVPNDQIVKYMQSHAMLVVPSVVHANGDRDGIPNVIMEALSQCMPVIATDVCGISEVICNEKTGLLIPQRNPKALANAIRQILDDWPKAANMGVSGCQLVKEMFDRQKNSCALKNLYEDAINKKI